MKRNPTPQQVAKWFAWGWSGASGRHYAKKMRGETSGRKLKRIERRARLAVRRWEDGNKLK